jgi:hypothetical protein
MAASPAVSAAFKPVPNSVCSSHASVHPSVRLFVCCHQPPFTDTRSSGQLGCRHMLPSVSLCTILGCASQELAERERLLEAHVGARRLEPSRLLEPAPIALGDVAVATERVVDGRQKNECRGQARPHQRGSPVCPSVTGTRALRTYAAASAGFPVCDCHDNFEDGLPTILSYPILSYPILSYPILSYPILLYTCSH